MTCVFVCYTVLHIALLNTCGMQESERSRKKLTPVMELKLEQGLYKGRCLAGLPDGKVRNSFIPSSSFVFGTYLSRVL